MKPRRLIFAGLMVLLATAGVRAARWKTDFDEAQASAQLSNKLMLLDFTGSDWCGWCMRLDAEVFSI